MNLLNFFWLTGQFILRDEAVTKEFVNSLKKVAPSLGMSMGSPKVFMLNDNRPATYIQQLDQVIDMKPAIVMVVIPNNKVCRFWVWTISIT